MSWGIMIANQSMGKPSPFSGASVGFVANLALLDSVFPLEGIDLILPSPPSNPAQGFAYSWHRGKNQAARPSSQ